MDDEIKLIKMESTTTWTWVPDTANSEPPEYENWELFTENDGVRHFPLNTGQMNERMGSWNPRGVIRKRNRIRHHKETQKVARKRAIERNLLKRICRMKRPMAPYNSTQDISEAVWKGLEASPFPMASENTIGQSMLDLMTVGDFAIFNVETQLPI
eukprot:TRINITY_DN11366_c0_g1_i4.p2 TRINITY_DN11366_c0_g1~~TRINITY_DN11366_c0_g1_i4.p2  ORF type:complete len:156 (-),score=11.23 TRINITY_DN11366_c0_g1_i4:270-737(-)